MNSIRLKRIGSKKQASYRIVVIDSRSGTSGASVERLGLYNPRMQPSLVRLDAARTLYWLREGAEPSDTVRSLLRKTGVWKQFHDGVTPEALEEKIVYLGPAPGRAKT
ncbi:MAG: 30S ribosomal protein S16, partial [Gemmatimonadota bacterium]